MDRTGGCSINFNVCLRYNKAIYKYVQQNYTIKPIYCQHTYHLKFNFQLNPPHVMSDACMYSNVVSDMTSMMGHTTVLLSSTILANNGSSHPSGDFEEILIRFKYLVHLRSLLNWLQCILFLYFIHPNRLLLVFLNCQVP